MKLAPGLRIRVSSRGVRAGIGPRALRLHVGTGRPGVSTGIGPFGAYTSLVPRIRPTHYSTGQLSRDVGTYRTRLTSYEKAEAAAQISTVVSGVMNLHRVEFPASTRLVAPAEPAPDRMQILARNKAAALRGLSVFARRERKVAIERAEQQTEHELAQMTRHSAEERAARQRYLDEQWAALVSNDPQMVLATLAAAFEDNDATAVPVGIEGGMASIAVLVPGEQAIPDRLPSTTPAGNLSLRQATKAQRNSLYVEMVAGYALATIKEALAVCPGLVAVKVVTFRGCPADAYGRARAEVVAATTVPRHSLDGIRWSQASASKILNDASSELYLNQNSRSFALDALAPASFPGMQEFLEHLDLEELV